MQYKNTQKIVIDKRKLEILLRLNCPKENIYEAIVNNKIIYTDDELINDNLESFVDLKIFDNWGGARNGSGRKPSNNKKKNQLENQLENQDANQDVNQEPNQVVDIDIDIDIDKDKDINILFANFYSKYPNKKGKDKAFNSFKNVIAKKRATYEELMNGLNCYIQDIANKKTEKQYIKHPATWLNQGCWQDEYEQENKKQTQNSDIELVKQIEQERREEYGW